jgi:hypothetical protein
MANLNAPNGLSPVRHMKGGVVRLEQFSIASGFASNIFQGDAVRSTGTADNIQLATAAADIVGVFAGCQYVAANGDVVFSNRWVASTATLGAVDAVAYVYADPDLVFRAQITTVAAADIGTFADLVLGAGNATTGVSGHTVVLAGDQFRVLRLAREPAGISLSEYGANAKVELQCVRHERFPATLATAV